MRPDEVTQFGERAVGVGNQYKCERGAPAAQCTPPGQRPPGVGGLEKVQEELKHQYQGRRHLGRVPMALPYLLPSRSELLASSSNYRRSAKNARYDLSIDLGVVSPGEDWSLR